MTTLQFTAWMGTLCVIAGLIVLAEWIKSRKRERKAKRLEANRMTRRRRVRWPHSRWMSKRRRRHKATLGIPQQRVNFDMKPIQNL